jgi:hypothetical protein
VLTLYLASIVPTVDAITFWAALRNPDAYELRGTELTRLGES